MNPDWLFLAILAFMGLWILVRSTRFGSFRGGLFGARIQATVGEVTGSRPGYVQRTVRVHILDGPPERAVGLEVVWKTFASYGMHPVTLSLSEARNLSSLLEVATRNVASNVPPDADGK